MADSVTVLTSLTCPLAKTIYRTAAGLTVEGNPKARYFAAEELPVDSIDALITILDDVASDPHKCVVRGGLAATANRDRMLRRSTDKPGEPATLVETPRQWVMLDFDSLPLPFGLDQFAEPEHAAAIARNHLPPAFHNATCWYQFTASAGVKPGLRMRLAFWLSRRLSSQEAKWWLGQKIPLPGVAAKDWLKEFPIDNSLFSPAHIHFTSAPILSKDACDPLANRCKRSGVLRGALSTVSVPLIQEPRTQRIDSSSAASRHGTAPLSFDECLESIGDHKGGRGCHEAVRRAVAIWVRRNGSKADPAPLLSAIRTRLATAEWDSKQHRPEYVQREADRISSLIETIRDQQSATEQRLEDEFEAATCPWDGPELSLEDAARELNKHVGKFFAETVPQSRSVKIAYRGEVAAYDANEATRRSNEAELEFAAETDSDVLFEMEQPPTAPVYPRVGVKITAGAGKTQAAINHLVDAIAGQEVFVYAVPTHDKAEEIAHLANEVVGQPIAAIWRGMEREDPENPAAKMCQRHSLAREVIKAGGKLQDLCGSKQRGYCPFHPKAGGTCGYKRQEDQQPKLWVVPHAFLARKPPPQMENVNALVIDEGWSLEIKSDVIDLANLTGKRSTDNSPLNSILPRLSRAFELQAPDSGLSREAFEAANLTARDCDVARRCEQYELRSVPTAVSPTADDVTVEAAVTVIGATNRLVSARMTFWRELAHFLSGESATSGRLRLTPDERIEVCVPQHPHPLWLDRPVLHLDATLDENWTRIWLPRLEIVANIRVERGAGVTVHQVIDSAVGYGKIIPGIGAEAGTPKALTQERTLRRVMRAVEIRAAEDRRENGRTGLIGPKRFLELCERAWAEWGTRPANLITAHLGALRGLNAMEDVARLILISRVEPLAAEIELIARVQAGEHPCPAVGSGFLPKRFISLRRQGNSRDVVEIPFHPDTNAMAVLAQIRDAELEQAVHRGRPVRRGGDRPLTIEIITSTPVDLVLDSVGTFEEWIEHSPAEILLARGFWPSSWEGKQAVLRDLYDTAQAVRRGFEENRTALEIRRFMEGAAAKGAQMPYNEFHIRGLGRFQDAARWPRFKYRLDRARRSHEVAVDPVAHPEPRKAWEHRLGRPLAAFEAIAAPKVPAAAAATVAPSSPPMVALSATADQPAAFSATVTPPLAAPTTGAPMTSRAVTAPAHPTFTVQQLAAAVGVSSFALKNTLERTRYRRLPTADRDRAAIQWLVLKVGRGRFFTALRELEAKLTVA